MTKAAAIVFAALAIGYLALRPAPSRGALTPDVKDLASRIAAHPTDWLAASFLTEKALDASVRDRAAFWHASNELATSLAPYRPEPRTAFARSGFFHWGELSEADRKAVLDAYAPVLRDPMTFSAMYQMIFELTGDLDYLRRAQPRTTGASRSLAWLAGAYGRFDDYRAIRAELEREQTDRPKPAPVAKDRWSGLCGENVCSSAWREVDANHAVAVTVTNIDAGDLPSYVEIYVDDARRAEGVVEAEQTFTAPVGAPGTHRVEVRLANPISRNMRQRHIRITALQTL